MSNFNTVKDLQIYSGMRFKIRISNQRIHRMKKGVLKSLISRNSEDSLYKNKSKDELEVCTREQEYRDIITSLRLPVVVKII